jgi:type IV pilus assembly protein PilC
MTITIQTYLQPLLGHITNPGPFSFFEMPGRVTVVSVLFSIWLCGIGGIIYLIHFLMTLPMRRAERARLFLDLLESALKRGQSPEAMVLSIAQNRDRTLGARFHMLAAYIESGLSFGVALEKAPRFLPPQINAMLHAGEKMGDLRRVLPACREILRDRPQGVRSAVHYMFLVVLVFSPAFATIFVLINLFVIPRFKEVAAGMSINLWPLTKFIFADAKWLMAAEIVLFLLLVATTLLYIGGPQFSRLFQFRRLPFVDWVAWKISWKRKRLKRTFSAMLAVLLDGGVPEAEAIRLAGDCTANEIYRNRAQRVIAAIEQGTKLNDAVRMFDDSGEFHWRLTNATHARGGFLAGLRGWHEALDAKAFQQEEATAHALTSALVLLNGVAVGIIVIGMFGVIIALLRAMALST